MRPIMLSITSSLALLLWVALPAQAQQSLTGPIKAVAAPGKPVGKGGHILHEGYSVKITKDTIIVFSDARRATIADLKVGQIVSVGSNSDIADTCPPQTFADVIVIHAGKKSDRKVER